MTSVFVSRVLRSRVLAFVTVLLLAESSRAELPTVRVRLSDPGPTAARVRVVGSDGKSYHPEGAVIRTTKRGETYFYADGRFEVQLPPGPAQLHFDGGPELRPHTEMLDPADPQERTITLQTWIDMAARGWYSGDSHVHLHTGGPLQVTVSDALVAARAEGLNYVNLCVSNNVGDDIRDADLITGKPHELSTARHLLVFGEEMRSSIYGHMQFFGIHKLVEPQYTGFDNTPQQLDFPANYVMAAEACRQGGLVTYGHPMFADQPFPFSNDLTAGNAAARELPIDAMLNVVQAVDLMCYNSDEPRSAELWYRLLNCGLKLSACVGTDALLDRSTDPMGGDRVYVQVDGPLSMAGWLAGLKQGRTFVTNGPLLDLAVDGAGPGETRELPRGKVLVRARVESQVPVERLVLLMNGRVVAEKELPQPGTAEQVLQHTWELEVPLERSSWVALRAHGPDHPQVFDGPVWAHSSPVYLLVDRQPVRSPEDARYFVDWIEQLLRVVAARDRYARVEDRRQVEELFRRAQEKFRLQAQAG